MRNVVSKDEEVEPLSITDGTHGGSGKKMQGLHTFYGANMGARIFLSCTILQQSLILTSVHCESLPLPEQDKVLSAQSVRREQI